MCSLCKYLLTIFSCRTSAWKLWREMQLTKLFDKQNVRHLGKAKMKTQQIKYYWGWCQPHKNAWKLGMHVSSTRTFLCRPPQFQLKNVQQFLRWRLIFRWFSIRFSNLSLAFSTKLPGKQIFPLEGCWGKICFLSYFTSVSLRSWNRSDIHDVGIKLR